jgi:peroxiredoxin
MTILKHISHWLGADKKMTHIVAGNMAPGFSLKGLDGSDYSLQKLIEQGPVVAAFFKVSCPVCQFTFPFLERLYKRYGGDGGAFLGISQDDPRDTKEFAKEFGVTFPMLLDQKEKNYPASNAYGLTNVPTVFLIETDGTVKISCMGFDRRDLQSIAAELAERRKMAPSSLFLAGESVPDHKPG